MTKKVWTDEMTAIAAGMKRAGMTHKAIAARLGVSENAVKGRMGRLGARRRLDGHSGGCWAPPGRLTLGRLVTHEGREV